VAKVTGVINYVHDIAHGPRDVDRIGRPRVVLCVLCGGLAHIMTHTSCACWCDASLVESLRARAVGRYARRPSSLVAVYARMVYRLSIVCDGTDAGMKHACGVPMVPITGTDDAIDDALNAFRANVLFRKFDVRCGADKLLVVLTFFASEVLKRFERCANKGEGEKAAKELALARFACPGDGDFEFGGLLPAPETRVEGDEYRTFMKRCREAIALRLVERCFDGETGAPNKFWMAFSKRKFMNKTPGTAMYF
jgi:actin related protein 2/3 complex, subunit 3